MPAVLQNVSLKAALDFEFPSIMDSEKPHLDNTWLRPNKLATYTWEGDVDEFESESVLTTHPWDDPINRERWQFQQRIQHQITIEQPDQQSHQHHQQQTSKEV